MQSIFIEKSCILYLWYLCVIGCGPLMRDICAKTQRDTIQRSMPITKCQVVLVCAIICNCLILFYVSHVQNINGEWFEQSRLAAIKQKIAFGKTKNAAKPSRQFESEVTVVFLEFEEFENDLPRTIRSILDHFPNIHVVVISRKRPYPPLELPNGKIQLVVQEVQPDLKQSSGRPENYITTPYVMFVPDSVRFDSTSLPVMMLSELKAMASIKPQVKVLAVPVKTKKAIQCNNLAFDVKRWTLEYSVSEEEAGSYYRTCDSVSPSQVILLKTAFLHSLSAPYMRPFPESVFIQASLHHIKTKLLHKMSFSPGFKLFTNAHTTWKFENNVKTRTVEMYRKLGVKKVAHPSGQVSWYGCAKDTGRCFGTVYDDMPEYLYMSRWTPPCCLDHLRETARYLFDILNTAGVRYWLEGGSLLGAARYGDIIPWDYDVDIGIFQHEISKCSYLAEAEKHSNSGTKFVDDKGYTWEKATEGDFYRIQYSQYNHLHVDIFPFFEKDGVMTKRTWFKTHRQDREFPASYLKPLETIDFVGIKASAPNHVREFLEFKFGKGVIENPQYPNPLKLKKKSNVKH